MPNMQADCIHGYDMGNGCSICKPQPVVGKPFTFEMAIDLDTLTECGGIDGLNDMMDNEFWDRFGEGWMLGDISYKPIRITQDQERLVVIEVTAGTVEKYGDGDND